MSSKDVLLVSSLKGAEACAALVAENLGVHVDLARTRQAALQQLRRSEFTVVVVEQALIEADPEWADSVWEQAGPALPLELNFAISGSSRLTREVKSALARWQAEQVRARRAVAMEMENELKGSVTGLLLQSELALQEPTVPPTLEPKLRQLVVLAGELRERLRREAA